MIDVEESPLNLDEIRIDGGTQPRCAIDADLVAAYAEGMTEGETFPPVVVFFDGVDNWLADGFHRYHAAARAGCDHLDSDVRNGTQRDAILYSVGANATHGQRRTNADKRKAVMTLLGDAEWGGWSDSEIARRCAVSHMTVARHRESLEQSASDMSERHYIDRHGHESTMNTENIGRAHEGREEDGSNVPKMPEGYGTISPKAHRPTLTPEPMTPMTSFQFPHDPVIVAAALYESFGAGFVSTLIHELETLAGGNDGSCKAEEKAG